MSTNPTRATSEFLGTAATSTELRFMTFHPSSLLRCFALRDTVMAADPPAGVFRIFAPRDHRMPNPRGSPLAKSPSPYFQIVRFRAVIVPMPFQIDIALGIFQERALLGGQIMPVDL